MLAAAVATSDRGDGGFRRVQRTNESVHRLSSCTELSVGLLSPGRADVDWHAKGEEVGDDVCRRWAEVAENDRDVAELGVDAQLAVHSRRRGAVAEVWRRVVADVEARSRRTLRPGGWSRRRAAPARAACRSAVLRRSGTGRRRWSSRRLPPCPPVREDLRRRLPPVGEKGRPLPCRARSRLRALSRSRSSRPGGTRSRGVVV